MSAEQLTAVSLIIGSVGAVITAIGVILIALMRSKVAQVEKTGEAVHVLVNSNMGLQLRVSAVALRRVADMTSDTGDARAAEMAEQLLAEHEAKQAAVDASEQQGPIT